MALLQCEVLVGLRAGFKEVEVSSVEGHKEYLALEERFLVRHEDDYLLPVRIIAQDRAQDIVLVQLPVEADSGANRVWVWRQHVIKGDEVPA